MEKIIDTESKNSGKIIIALMHNPNEDIRLIFKKEESKKEKKLNRLFKTYKSSVKHIHLPTSRNEELISPNKFWDSAEGKLWLEKNDLDVL